MLNITRVFVRYNCFCPSTKSKSKHFSIREHRQRSHWRRYETASRVRYILLSAALVTVLAGIKLGGRCVSKLNKL